MSSLDPIKQFLIDACRIPTAPFSWKQCLWLCVPALLIGAVLRVSLMIAIPEGYYGPDTNSYLHTAMTFWHHHEIAIMEKRRWLYPILLAGVPALPGRTINIVPVIHHLLGLATLPAIGYVTAHVVRFRFLWVPVVTVLAAIWPRAMLYEHEIISESLLLFVFAWACALGFPLAALKDQKKLLWFLIGTALLVATKPAGKPLWLGLIIVAFLVAGRPWLWARKNWGALAFSILMYATVGAKEHGSWLLLSSTLPLVQTTGEKWAVYREALRADIEEARGEIDQYPWRQGKYKTKLAKDGDESPYGQEWGNLVKSNRRFSKVARDLAIEGVASAPLTFAAMVVRKIGRAVSDDNPGATLEPQRFWRRQIERNEGLWQRQPDRMKMVYEMDEAAYHALVAERTTRTLWFVPYLDPFTKFFAWTKEIKGKRSSTPIRWSGVLVCLGLLTCFLPGRWKQSMIVWLPFVLYFGIVFSIGDGMSRYLQVIEWVALILLAMALDLFGSFVAAAFGHGRTTRETPAPDAPVPATATNEP